MMIMKIYPPKSFYQNPIKRFLGYVQNAITNGKHQLQIEQYEEQGAQNVQNSTEL